MASYKEKIEKQNEEYLKYVKKSCDTCEFGSNVCMEEIINPETGEKVYGMPIDDAMRFYPDGCDAWGISLCAFEDYIDQKEGQQTKKAKSKSTKKEPKLTIWEANAIQAAKEHISVEGNFYSRSGLIDALTDDTGDEFETKEAETAVKYLEVNKLIDWNEQAAGMAQILLKRRPFSKKGLIYELKNMEGFTEEEASFAVNAVEKAFSKTKK